MKVLPSKLVNERITVEFSFLDELDWGETIASAIVTVEVLSGEDPDPQSIVFSSITLAPTTIRQKIQGGIPGVIYLITCAAEGTTGSLMAKTAKMAILPVESGIPPFSATYYTSTIYPAEEIESIEFSMVPLGGVFETLIVTTNFREQSRFAMLPLSGELRHLLKSTTNREAASFAMVPQSGTNDTVLITTAPQKTEVSFAAFPVNGTLDVVLLTTTYREAASFGMAPLSGTKT